MKNLFNYILALSPLILFLTSCTKEPEGLADCASHRDSVANIRQDSDNSARFFGAWTVYKSACNLPPVLSGYQFTIEPDIENYPEGILINGYHPEYTEQLRGNCNGSSFSIPLSIFINSDGDTLSLSADAAFVETADTLFLNSQYQFKKGSGSPLQVCIPKSYKLIQ